MKDIKTTWSHIIGRKYSKIRVEKNITQQKIADDAGISQTMVSSLLGRKEVGNDDNFTRIGFALGLDKKVINNILNSSMYEAIELEFPEAGLGFALKSKFGLSEGGLMDVLNFISEIQEKEAKSKK